MIEPRKLCTALTVAAVAAFAAACLPILALIFGNHIWSSVNGYAMARPVSEFAGFGTTLWSYVVPSGLHRANAVMPVENFYGSAGFTAETVGERISYLGIVTLLLVHQAAVNRARIARRGFWWCCLGLLAVLEQNPSTTWTDLIGGLAIENEHNTDLDPLPEDAEEPEEVPSGTTAEAPTPTQPRAGGDDDELTSFTL